jgi:hypothetical protein
MPRVVRWFLKTALVYFAAALLLNIWLSLARTGPLRPVFLHLLMVGWISQLIMGVAIWMFPKYSQSHPRGREGLNWAVYGLLNAGLLLRAASEPMLAAQPTLAWQYLIVLSALLQWLAGMLFAGMAWPRVKER